MKKVAYHVLLTLFLCWISNLATPQKMPFVNFDFKNGFNRSVIYHQFQDSRGVLWFSSESGAVSFDGNKFRYFTKKEGFTNGNSVGFVEDDEGRLWMASEKHLYFYNGSTFQKIKNEVEENNVIQRINYDRAHNYLWISKTKGIYYLDLSIEEEDFVLSKGLSKDLAISDDYVMDAYLDHNNRLWLSCLRGSVVLEEQAKDSVYLKAGRLNFSRFAVVPRSPLAVLNQQVRQDKENNYLIASWAGGFSFLEHDFDPKNINAKIHHFNTENGATRNNRIWFFEEQKSQPGTYWVGLDGFGLQTFKLDEDFSILPETSNIYQAYNGLPNTHLLSMLEDHEGNLWFSTLKGISKLSGKVFQTFTESEGLLEQHITTVEKDKTNTLWIGTWGGGLFSFDGNEFERYFWDEGISESVVTDLKVSPNGDVYLSCMGGGLSILPKENIGKKGPGTFLPKIMKIDGYNVRDAKIVFIDSKSFWAYNPASGFAKIGIEKNRNHRLINHYNFRDNDTKCNSIWSDEKGRGWFFTSDGIYIIDPRKGDFIHWGKNFRINLDVFDMDFDEDGNMWLATAGQGIIVVDKRAVLHPEKAVAEDLRMWSAEKNLEHLDLNGIHKEKEYILAGSTLGFIKFTLSGDSVKYVNEYNLEDGFWGFECSPAGILKFNEKDFFVATTNGLTNVKPHLLGNSKQDPLIHIKDIRINYEHVNWQELEEKGTVQFNALSQWYNLPEKLVLPYDKNHLTFDFFAVTFNKNNEVKYKFKLEGYDNNWNPITSDQKATYANLAPGKYTFKFTAMSSDGLWSKQLEYSFEIKAPFWKTIGFIIFVMVSFVLLVFAIIRGRTKRLKKRNLELERKVAFRTAQISSQNEELASINKEITDSILYAKNIQQGILPDLKLFQKFFSESFVLFKPKDIVSGDFYWAKEDEKFFYFAVVDCTGHGVPGAFVSIVGSNALKKAVAENTNGSPAEILNSLNTLIEEAFANSEHASLKDGMDLSLCVLNKETKVLKFSGAYNPIWLVDKKETRNIIAPKNIKETRYGTSIHLREIPANKQPIGKFEHRTPFEESEFQLEKDDTLYILSDGYADQFGGKDNKKFKKKNLKKLLAENQNLNLSEQQIFLEKNLSNWMGENEQVDDVCVIGVRL